jgi:hypothetical protein
MDKDVLCPFFKKYDSVRICCEGIEGENSSVYIVFPSPKARRDYLRAKCCRDYKVCLMAKMNERKWEGK